MSLFGDIEKSSWNTIKMLLLCEELDGCLNYSES